MSLERITQSEGSIARRYRYDDEELLVADFGTADVSVDVLDDVAIFVVEGAEDNYQTEVELPEGEAQAFINNGVVTVEVRR
ncbi:DUF7127 family protein [Halomicrococcus gelatinilyticus]|uniref:DUF7127 family protein n=1 Tax=Halomicrococcus gelatinilyticus TaxID=1702103 RepID=UPI002E0F65A6